MLTKDETKVVEVPENDPLTNMLLEQQRNQQSLDPIPTAFANNGGVNDPPEGTG